MRVITEANPINLLHHISIQNQLTQTQQQRSQEEDSIKKERKKRGKFLDP
jgi:flagellar biogenesis protein FliO